jgi:tyrosyl-tRNA synthetase
LNVQDAEAIRLLKIFTLETKEKIEEVEALMKTAPEKRDAQKLLADSICTFVHGAQATADAKKCALALFSGTLSELSNEQILEIFEDAPSSAITRSQVDELDILTLLSTTVSKSKGEARRLVQAGGIYLDSERVSNEALKIKETAILSKGFVVVRSGKKNYHLVRLAD